MVFNKKIWVKSLTNQGKCAMWDMCIYMDKDVWGIMITKLVKDVLYIPYIFPTSLSLMISVIISKMFVDNSVYNYAQNSLLRGLQGP